LSNFKYSGGGLVVYSQHGTLHIHAFVRLWSLRWVTNSGTLP